MFIHLEDIAEAVTEQLNYTISNEGFNKVIYQVWLPMAICMEKTFPSTKVRCYNNNHVSV